MDYRLVMLLGAVVCVGGGCQNTRASLTALENENRRLEDRVYQLEDALNQHCDVVDSLDRENQQLRAQTVTVSGFNSNGGKNGNGNSANTNGGNGNGPPRDLTPPKIDLGDPEASKGSSTTEKSEEDSGPAPPFDGPAPKFPSVQPGGGTPAISTAFDASSLDKLHAASADCMRITLDRLKGSQLAHSGQQGIVVIVEPRNAGGKLISVLGEVSLVVIDTQRSGASARLARWDFSTDQAAQCLRNTALGQRMFFHLDWPDAPAGNQHLRLHARLRTVDGRALQVDAPLELDAGRSIIREWNKDEQPTLASEPASKSAADEPVEDAIEQEKLEVNDVFAGSADATATTEEPQPQGAAASTAEEEPSAEDTVGREDADEDRRAEQSPRSRRRNARAATRQRPVWAPYR